ncbi:hypothetical protein [Streptomyces sp. NPDC127100]|uniref:hypothetical protein n=1 Tax=Streptomyces sp. NPDC127100 TaxID=3347138 RepID=UPI00366A05B3
MRNRRALTIGVALIALGALGACQNGDEDGPGAAVGSSTGTGTGDDGRRAESGADAGSEERPAAGDLPQAADMASIEYYLNKYTECLDLTAGEDYSRSGGGTAWGEEEAADASWGITQRAVCQDGDNRPIALLSVPDMTKFQTAALKDGHAVFYVGQDFAVVPVGDDTIRELEPSDLAFLTCDPDFSVPSGYRTWPGAVEGCVLTDYVPSD